MRPRILLHGLLALPGLTVLIMYAGSGDARVRPPSDVAEPVLVRRLTTATKDELLADSIRSTSAIVRIDTVRVDSVRLWYTRRDTVRIPTVATGLPFGPFDLFGRSWTTPAMPGFSGAVAWVSPDGLLLRLQGLRTNKVKAFLQLTGDPHCTYVTTGCDSKNKPNPGGVFSLAKWTAALSRYTSFKAAIDSAVQEGWILGYDMIDEPNHPSWGGNITKATTDSMAAISKSLFPSLPAGVTVDWHWRPNETWRVVDFILTQTWMTKATPAAWRDSALAVARQNNVGVALSLNLYGGRPVPGCVLYQETCTLTPAERREWLLAFVGAPDVCAVTMWKLRLEVDTLPEYRQVLNDIARVAALRSAPPCRRTG